MTTLTRPLKRARIDAESPAPALVDPRRVSWLGWACAGLVLVQLLLFLPDSTSIAPAKAALLMPLAALGLPFLVAMALGRTVAADRRMLVWGARFALAFLAWSALSAALAATPESAFFGLYVQLTGWFFLLCLAGAWAVATKLNTADRGLLELAIIAGATGNAIVAVIQQHVDLSSVGLPLYQTTLQPTGMLGNPVFFGALLAASLALVIPRFLRSPLIWAPVAVTIGLGLGVCGERLPSVLTVLLVIGEILFVARNAHRSGARGVRAMSSSLWPIVLFSIVTLGSLVVGSLTAGSNTSTTIPNTSAPTTGGTAIVHGGVINHIQSSTSYETFGQRFDIWKVAWHAFWRRPLVGYGPNQFREATLGHYNTSLIKVGQQYDDGHNLIVELAVTVGIIGLILFAAWMVCCFRRVRGPLVLFAVVLLASELFEPLNLVITALLFVALGAAVIPGHESVEERAPVAWRSSGRLIDIAALALAVLAAVASVPLLIGDEALAEGTAAPPVSAQAMSDASTAETLLSPWPNAAELKALIYAKPELNSLPLAVSWQQTAVDKDRTNPQLLQLLAVLDLSIGHERAAKEAVSAAVAAQPWLSSALDLLGAIDQRQGDARAARQLYLRSLSYYPDQPLITDFLNGSCIPLLPGSIRYQPLSLGCGRP